MEVMMQEGLLSSCVIADGRLHYPRGTRRTDTRHLGRLVRRSRPGLDVLAVKFRLDAAGVARFRRKLINLNVCGREDGQDLLGPKPNFGRVRDTPLVNMSHVNAIHMLGKRSFQFRYLVEGLVSHGLVVPSEIPDLLQDLDTSCRKNEELKTRVLTALFNEEHLHRLRAVVFGKPVTVAPLLIPDGA